MKAASPSVEAPPESRAVEPQGDFSPNAHVHNYKHTRARAHTRTHLKNFLNALPFQQPYRKTLRDRSVTRLCGFPVFNQLQFKFRNEHLINIPLKLK